MASRVLVGAAHRLRRLLAASVVAILAGASAVGCGSDDDPTEAVPALADRLESVDTAIAREDYPAARRAIDALVRAATEARDDGDLEADQADAILAAAARLEAQLPERTGIAPSETEPTDGETSPSVTETAEPETDPDAEDEGEGRGKGHGKSEGKGQSKGKSHD